MSYMVSMVFQNTLIIDLMRANYLLSRRFSQKNVMSNKFCNEKRVMLYFWTKGLKQEEIDKGNTYMVT
jgi:hypothetical protein